MAKITLKSYEELIVPEERARAVFDLLEEKKKEENNGGLPLSAWPLTIDHEDGMWIGNLSSIGQISLSDKKRVLKHTFKNREDIKRFHNEYGGGAFKEFYKEGYGLVDIKTQFLIKIKQLEFRDNKLVSLRLPKEAQEKWMDLWSVYEIELNDLFHEF